MRSLVPTRNLLCRGCRTYIAAALALFVSQALAQAMVLEVIPLQYRTAEQVIPIIQPMLAPGGGVSGLQNRLVVRTTPENLQEIRRILASVDARPRRLLITVRQDADSDAGRRAAEVSGSVQIGDNARVTVPGTADRRAAHIGAGPDDDGLRARVVDTRRAQSERSEQTVQVLEGNSAFIRIGQSVPVPQQQMVQTVIGGRVVTQVIDGMEYRDVGTGFNVLPRVSGDIVTLDINPQHDTSSRRLPGAIDTQRVATTVSGRLGEWMEIAGLNQDRSSGQSALLGRASGGSTDNRRVLIKVEELR